MLDAVKPEIILFDWERKKIIRSKKEFECLCFKSIKNIGKGPALNVLINPLEYYKNHNNKPQIGCPTNNLSILPVGEKKNIDGKILIFWENVKSANGTKYLSIKIQVLSWCLKNYRHKSLYKLMILYPIKNHVVFGSEQVAPGVLMSRSKTISEPVKLLKLYSMFKIIIKKFIQILKSHSI